ncbi:MAG: flagellar biosynthesis anti-sigma factor FlgM [Acidobacteriota bacterium]
MKIDLNNSAQLPANDWSAQKAHPSNGLASQGLAEDRVTLSSLDGTAAALAARAMSTPQIRQDKVGALRQAISNGSYQLDPAKIAHAISADESH